MADSRTVQLIRQVARRQTLARAGREITRALLVSGVVALVIVVLNRVCSLWPTWDESWVLLAWPLVAGLVLLLRWRSCEEIEAAHLLDRQLGSKDLFTTARELPENSGSYGDIVLRDADQKAASVQARQVIIWKPWQAFGRVAGLAAALILLTLFLPYFDPFGRHAESQALAQRQARLLESREVTTTRKQELAKKTDRKEELSEEVKRELAELKRQLQAMKPTKQDENRKSLQRLQSGVGKLFSEKRRDALEEALQRKDAQQLGGMQGDKRKKLTDGLKAGDTSALQKELQKLADKAKALAGADPSDPETKRALKQLKREMADLKNLADKQLGSPQLSDSMKRAMQQLDMSQLDGMQSDAMEALAESLELAKMDAEQLGQAMRDMQELKEALKALQQAKALNSQGKLDGGDCKGCGDSMSDYAKLYEELMAKQGGGQGNKPGQGGGMKGPGQGEGGQAPMDDSVKSSFTPEKAKSHVKAGKMLMEWKVKELGEKGKAMEAYAEQVEKIKQGLSEAIEHEEVPPGYHESIKAYFDDLAASPGGPDASVTPTGGKQGSASDQDLPAVP